MSELPTLAVTGSTGYLGGHVAAGVSAAGVDQRLLVRDRARAPQLQGATLVAFSYEDAGLAASALEGVKVLFMVSIKEGPQRLSQHTTLIDAAAQSGVNHIVYTSFMDAPSSSFTLAADHAATEAHIRESGMTFTFLRYNFYSDFIPSMVGSDGVLRGPAGDGRISIVTRDDVARCAAAVLINPQAHANATYTLTGPASLSMNEIADIIAEVTGSPTSYHAETVEEAYASRLAWPAEQWEYDSWVTTYTAIAAGELERVSGDVEALTGRRPTAFRDFLIEKRRDS